MLFFLFAVVEDAGFVDDAGEFFDDSLAVELVGLGDADKGKMCALEELFHVLWIATERMVGFVAAVVEFDGADGTQGALIAEDEINGFILDEAIGFVAILATDFVIEQGREADLRNDIESLTKNVVEKLKTLAFSTDHEILLRAITTTRHGFGAALASIDASQNRDDQKSDCSNPSNDNQKCIHTKTIPVNGYTLILARIRVFVKIE